MKFLEPNKEILKIIHPDDFIRWQKEAFFKNVHIYPTYDMQVTGQCNFATMWGLLRLRLEDKKGFFVWGEFDEQQHSWILYDGLYYDLTIQQFTPLYPKLAVCKPNKHYKIIEQVSVDDIPLSLDKWDMGQWLEKTFTKHCVENGSLKEADEIMNNIVSEVARKSNIDEIEAYKRVAALYKSGILEGGNPTDHDTQVKIQTFLSIPSEKYAHINE